MLCSTYKIYVVMNVCIVYDFVCSSFSFCSLKANILQLEPQMCTNMCWAVPLISISSVGWETYPQLIINLHLNYTQYYTHTPFIYLLLNNKDSFELCQHNYVVFSVRCSGVHLCLWFNIMYHLSDVLFRHNTIPLECNTLPISRLHWMKVHLSSNKRNYCCGG